MFIFLYINKKNFTNIFEVGYLFYFFLYLKKTLQERRTWLDVDNANKYK